MRQFAACVTLALLLAGAAPAADIPGAAVRDAFDLDVPVAPAPVMVEGRARLRYELHLTNFAAEPLRMSALQVADGVSGEVVAAFQGADLAARTVVIGADAAAQAAGFLAPGRRAVVYLDFDLERPRDALPQSLAHRIAYVAGRGARDGRVRGARIPVGTPPPPLGPPVRGGPWVVIYDASWARGHRRVFYATDGRARLPGRFATDWVRVDGAGRTARGDADLARDALAYGAAVIAVADATVVAVRSDYPEHARVSDNPKHALADASGNHVVLDLGNGRHAFYEHLRPRSLRVAVGQRVRKGQVLGALGFTGDSTGPHLHFHVADGASPFAAEGQPFALDGFRVLGRYTDLSRLGRAPWAPRASGSPAQRSAELPEGNSVVEIDAAR